MGLGGTDRERLRLAGRIAVTGVAAMLGVLAAAAGATAAPASPGAPRAASTAAVSARARAASAQPSGPTLVSWGDNSQGQLDNLRSGGTVLVPSQAQTSPLGTPGNQLTQVSVGCEGGVALTAGGQVMVWGSNVLDPGPVILPIPAPVKSVKSGCQFAMALDVNGHVWAWGSNVVGQLGGGPDETGGNPKEVKLPQGTVVTAISAGEGFGVALNRSGQLFAWGADAHGQLGDGGHRTGSDFPVRVHLPSGTKVTSVASGSNHSLALTSTGRILAWGTNAFGQLGDGTRQDRATPVKITMPSSVQKVAHVIAGGVFSLVLTAKGRLLSWGSNVFGELGDGTFTDRLRPVRVHQGGTNVTSAVAGDLHVLARTGGGGILAWGYNIFGQLGNGGVASSNLPITPDIPLGSVVVVGSGSGSNSSFAIMR
jgi:alpha-tubulin suppressor-like RCC1 family protein